MRNTIAAVKSNRKIAEGTWEMIMQVAGTAEEREMLKKIRPGQFINIRIEGLYLRRPLSICDWSEEEKTITVIYKTVGRGTEEMSRMTPGEYTDILWPLGNGYDSDAAGAGGDAAGYRRDAAGYRSKAPLLIGGGAGVPPMYGLCRRLIERGEEPVVVLGFRRGEDAFYRDAFEAMGARVIVTTEDGSIGRKGFVTGVIGALRYDRFYACGPQTMLRAVDEEVPEGIPGQMSFEERMGCGFGACMGCSCRTKYGSKRICKDGPVLERSEIVW